MTNDQVTQIPLLWCGITTLTVFALAYLLGKYNGRNEGLDDGRKIAECSLAELNDAMQDLCVKAEAMNSQMTPIIEDSQRYQLVRYYLENDHGGIAINAFYGPQAITSALELDAVLDQELDERGSSVSISGLAELTKRLYKGE